MDSTEAALTLLEGLSGPTGQVCALQRYTMERSESWVEKLWLGLSFHGIYSLLFIDVTVAGQLDIGAAAAKLLDQQPQDNRQV